MVVVAVGVVAATGVGETAGEKSEREFFFWVFGSDKMKTRAAA